MKNIKIVIVDDHEIVRFGMKMLFDSEPSIEVVGLGSNGKEALELVKEQEPDILILDINMPGMNGLDTMEELKKMKLPTKVLFLSMFDREEYVLKAVDSGAYGYLLKDNGKEKIIKALRTIMNGNKYFSSEVSNIIVNRYLDSKPAHPPNRPHKDYALTKREMDILSRIVKGDSNPTISEECGISVRTIETHRSKIMKKLSVNNAADMVRVALEQKIVALENN
ncbi:response regulator transcription factor [Xanthovirga aplysinae]|uniref:response regulator transcription factor n=1 Tax=Xanthovirga aplysinae TaxID=2529853 RepID=UPI0012BBF88F|nr:response regulator transcription factor [Xanthovirga aplysinae]MTI32446.1 response regulator transcription factor [Xanthovirga aplysinae]